MQATTDWTWSSFFGVLWSLLRWAIAIASVCGTLALFGWILMMILKKDKAK